MLFGYHCQNNHRQPPYIQLTAALPSKRERREMVNACVLDLALVQADAIVFDQELVQYTMY